jgi:pimeloyl-ACP methyl ester carboxylesterase
VSGPRNPPADPAAAQPSLRGTVLFFHGLWMTGAESLLLQRRLVEGGWKFRAFPYSSMREPLDVVARRGARFARMLAQRTRAPVHLMGHSLGGLVVYRMFEAGLLRPDRFSGDFCRVLLLGSPLQGSQTGRELHRRGATRLLLGETGSDELTRPHRRGDERRRWTFSAQLGVIAGSSPYGLGRVLSRLPEPNDGTVSLQETEIEGAADRCIIPTNHTGLLASPEAARQVSAFLATGHFEASLGPL